MMCKMHTCIHIVIDSPCIHSVKHSNSVDCTTLYDQIVQMFLFLLSPSLLLCVYIHICIHIILIRDHIVVVVVIDEPIFVCVCVSINNNCVLRHICSYSNLGLFPLVFC